MATSAISAFGTMLQKGDGATPENFTTIAEVRDINPPQLGLDTTEVTAHDSTGGWEDFVATILRSGEVGFDINYVPTEPTHDATTGLIADMVARTRRNWKLVFPDAGSATWNFAGFVKQMNPTAPVAGELKASIVIKVVGQPTLA